MKKFGIRYNYFNNDHIVFLMRFKLCICTCSTENPKDIVLSIDGTTDLILPQKTVSEVKPLFLVYTMPVYS